MGVLEAGKTAATTKLISPVARPVKVEVYTHSHIQIEMSDQHILRNNQPQDPSDNRPPQIDSDETKEHS